MNALKEEILKLLFDEKKAAEMTAKNIEFAQKRSWSAVAEAYEKAYIDLIKALNKEKLCFNSKERISL